MSRHPLVTLQEDDGSLLILDQTALPGEACLLRLRSLEDVTEAIRVMRVRGAPLIGAVAAYGVALAMAAAADDDALDRALAELAETRPTAVNLEWALARMNLLLRPLLPELRVAVAWEGARAIADLDRQANEAIGNQGLPLLQQAVQGGPTWERPLNVMTHCNAGWLATVAHGTALAPVYAAHQARVPLHVWVSETRPRNQGLLTEWELRQAGIPRTLVADNAAGLLMMNGQVDCVIVGADRIAANGDTANKVGTYLKALAAKAHGIPFYVAAPVSTIDFACPAGALIPIEERSGAELGAAPGVPVANPAFDVTPAELITAIITERGVFVPRELGKLQA